MTNCPACTTSMREAILHCNNADCVWLVCGSCGCVVSDYEVYFGKDVWGDSRGYLKAEG